MSYFYDELVKSLPNILPTNIQVVPFFCPIDEEEESLQMLVDYILSGEELNSSFVKDLYFDLVKFKVPDFANENSNSERGLVDWVFKYPIREEYILFPRNRMYTKITAKALLEGYFRFGNEYNLAVKSIAAHSYPFLQKVEIILWENLPSNLLDDFVFQLKVNDIKAYWLRAYPVTSKCIQIEISNNKYNRPI
jgi:hypothetical protein